jgi:hypothetical protein
MSDHQRIAMKVVILAATAFCAGILFVLSVLGTTTPAARVWLGLAIAGFFVQAYRLDRALSRLLPRRP